MSVADGKAALDQYADPMNTPAVFCMVAKVGFNPVDVNVEFLFRNGWSLAGDRLRFHTENQLKIDPGNPMAKLLEAMKPHLLIRRHDPDEGCFAAVHIELSGVIRVWSNDESFARKFFAGAFVEFPPSFHSIDEFEIQEAWDTDPALGAMFSGMLAGALGWDSYQNLPPALRDSLDEAEKALSISNYRSCVVMCRRALEAMMKFAFPRLLKRPATDKKGHGLTLNAMIEEFKKEAETPIPIHLLHVADSVRLVGNVPGAHAQEIKDYQFTRHNAEFALASAQHFVQQYFSKIDTDISNYYTLTIDFPDSGTTASDSGGES